MITLDTSGILALLDRTEPRHEDAVAVLVADRGPFLVPAGILAEVGYMIERLLGSEVIDLFLSDLEAGTLALDCGQDDLPRIRELVARYADLPLGTADASVVACAERNGGRILTLDARDFGAVAREVDIAILP
jgi:predicted nucleic acid-binding protein